MLNDPAHLLSLTSSPYTGLKMRDSAVLLLFSCLTADRSLDRSNVEKQHFKMHLKFNVNKV